MLFLFYNDYTTNSKVSPTKVASRHYFCICTQLLRAWFRGIACMNILVTLTTVFELLSGCLCNEAGSCFDRCSHTCRWGGGVFTTAETSI